MDKNERLNGLFKQVYGGIKDCKPEKCLRCKTDMLQALNVIENLVNEKAKDE